MSNTRTFSTYLPHLNQQKYHASTAKERVVVASVRSGKTFAILHEILVSAWTIEPEEPYPLPVILVSAPTFSQTKDLLFEAVKQQAIDIGLYKRSSSMLSSMEVELKNGRHIKFRTLGANAAETIRGITAKEAFVDECALVTEEAVNIVRGRLLTTNGRLTLITTPRGYASWLYQNYFSNTAKLPPDTELFKFHITDNPTITQEAINHLKAIYPPLLYKQEVDGEFVALNEKVVYPEFDYNRNVSNDAILPYNPKTHYNPLPIYVGIDYNNGKMPALLAYKDAHGRIIIFDELYGARTTAELGRQLTRYFPHNNINNITIIDDAKSGSAHMQTDGRTNREILTQLGFRKISSSRTNPPRLERYNNVNAHFCNALGNARILINPRCKHLIKDAQELSFKDNSDKPDTVSEKLGHSSDALGYLLNYISPWAGREGAHKRTQKINIQR